MRETGEFARDVNIAQSVTQLARDALQLVVQRQGLLPGDRCGGFALRLPIARLDRRYEAMRKGQSREHGFHDGEAQLSAAARSKIFSIFVCRVCAVKGLTI
jgi:hypothetical protein